ncbi:trypsin-like cysteine/serine peptidase domain-containing protein [Syncephalis fuscata]|nr:trypsin-like cysteine/serine peptidase domain-containing protein [Syncephalis fuscata]
MFKLDLLTTLTAMVIAASHMAKATPFNPVMKIAGGASTTITEFPFAARILYDRSGVCTGSIIGDRWILTAAHCVVAIKESEKAGKLVMNNPSKYTINIGLNSNANPTLIVPKNVYAHPKYMWATVRYDVGLLELSQPLKFTDAIQPVKLIKDESKLSANQMLTAAGWGIDSKQNFATKLNRVDLLNGSPEFCAKTDRNYLQYRDQILCTAYVRGKGICGGDSGGPLLAKVANSNGAVGRKAAEAWLQAGVHSYGINILGRSAGVCGEEGNVGFFARTGHFISWISQTTGMPVDRFTAPLSKSA